MNTKPFYTLVKTALPKEQIFMYQMPDTVTRGILIMAGVGGAQRDQDLPGYKKARLQAVIRATEYQSGYDLANRVITALDKRRQTIESVYILKVVPLHDPFPFAKSSGGYIEFSVNFEAVYVEK